MFNKVSFKSSSFQSIERFPKDCFLNVINTSFAAIADYINKYWPEGYTNVNLTINDNMVACIKIRNINSMFRRYSLVSTK